MSDYHPKPRRRCDQFSPWTLLFGIVLLSGCGPSKEERATDVFKRGLEHYQQRELDRAIADLTKAIRLNPENADAHHIRGCCYGQKGQYDTAIADCTEAIRLNPKYTEAYCDRGRCYGGKGEYDNAMADFAEAIRLNPKYADAYNSQGVAYGKMGEFDKAIAAFTETVRLDPNNALAYSNRGLLYKRNGEGAEAEFPGPRPAGFGGRVYAAHPAEGQPSDPVLRLVLEQVPRNAPQGGRGRGGGARGGTVERRGRGESNFLFLS